MMKTTLPPKISSAAFTLMELIITISIIAVLITLSFSGLRNMRIRGADITCVTHLRSSAQAMLRYFQDHNGMFFPKSYWYQYSSYRASSNKGMREYFDVEADSDINSAAHRHPTMLTCPAMLARYPSLRNDSFQRGYGVNFYLFRTYSASNGTPIPVDGYNNMRNHPSIGAMWLITDGAVPEGAAREDAGWLLSFINDNTAYHKTEFLPYPHSGKQNFAFFDGRIEKLDKQDLLLRRNDGNFWGNSTFNSNP